MPVAKETWIGAAREIYGNDDDIAIDDNAKVSEGEHQGLGAWVQAWVFVPVEYAEQMG